jgi:hypothetical protein
MPQSIEFRAAAIVAKLAQELLISADPTWARTIAGFIADDLRRFPGDDVEIEEAWRRGLAIGRPKART